MSVTESLLLIRISALLFIHTAAKLAASHQKLSLAAGDFDFLPCMVRGFKVVAR